MSTIDQMTARVRAEYLEMPGMRLKAEQVQRLCGMERMICQQVLESLVNAAFLCVNPEGRYARVTDAQFLRPRAADVGADTVSRKAS